MRADVAGPKAVRAATIVYAACAAAFAIVVGRLLVDARALAQTDFTAFETGWWLILHGRGHELYDVAAQTEAQRALTGGAVFPSGLLAFLHPPHAALAGVPLGLVAEHLGQPAAFRLWAAVNVALVVSLARTLGRLVAPASRDARLLVAAAIAGSFPIFLVVREGQVALLLAVALTRVGLAGEARDGKTRDGAAAAWLLVLSIKPQLLPVPLALFVAFRRWRALGLAAAAGAVAAGASAVVLGPDIFARYLRGLEALQAHLGRGVPGAMLTLRGLLVRAHVPLATTLAFAALGAAALACALASRRDARPARWRAAYATAAAAALFFSPHLFVGDLTLWAVPLALAASTLDPASPRARAFARFALAWPAVIALTIAVERWHRLFLETATILALVALIWIARLARRAPPASPPSSQPASSPM